MTTQSASIKVNSARKRRIASKPVQTVADPAAVAWAERLWARLESNLIDVQETVIAIIETRAWEPLGYESFAKAWVDRIMSKVPISVELRPHVVYELCAELTNEQVADVVDGISPESAAGLREQKAHGVPASQATTVVRRHNRRLPDSEWGFLHLKVEKETLREWKRLAKENDLSVTEFALMAVETAFGELV